MIFRITLNVLLFISILFFPWWISLAVAVVLLARYPAYEILLYGVFADSLYGVPLPLLHGMQFLFTTAFFIMLMLSFFIKRKIIFYRNI